MDKMSKGSIVQLADDALEGNLDELYKNLADDPSIWQGIGHLEYVNYDENIGEGQLIKLEEQRQEHATYEQDVQNVQLYMLPNVIVAKECFKGDLNFEVTIPANHGTKAPWVFSSSLNKIFTLERQKFPVHFKCANWQTSNNQLYVRATPIFSEAQHAQEFVRRCIAHRQPNDVTNKDFPPQIHDHVLRSGDPQAIYEGDLEGGQRLSVVMPLGHPQPGNDCVLFMYEFVCKNSCVAGMNRKPIEVVFTLEDQSYKILGRQTFGARICSCPKRDKEKEEGGRYKDKNEGRAKPSQGKKRKVDKPPSFTETSGPALDQKEYEVPAFKIIGKENAKAVLKYAYDLMAGDMARTGNPLVYRNCLNDIKQKNVNLVENSNIS